MLLPIAPQDESWDQEMEVFGGVACSGEMNGLKMVDEPMEEGKADSCQVSTCINLLSYHF
uniref:Ribosomal protein S6 kinase A6 n=1 Tax=Rousettus aegyptiacus TaxID=9407 RepID=A0A7J8ELH8_ROUAE|nr:ribosomal protein S6 kinase A6 [Rousettus aegyptiacus]